MNVDEMDIVTLVLSLESMAEEKFDEFIDDFIEEEDVEDAENLTEQETKDMNMKIYYDLVSDYIKYTVVDAFSNSISNEDNIEGVYVKIGDDIVNLDNIDDLSWSNYTLDPNSITVYIILNDPIDRNDGQFIMLSNEITNFMLIFNSNGKIVRQGFAEGDFDTGFISEDGEECYIHGSDDFYYDSAIASKSKITGE